jgi:hypothetical protein
LEGAPSLSHIPLTFLVMQEAKGARGKIVPIQPLTEFF